MSNRRPTSKTAPKPRTPPTLVRRPQKPPAPPAEPEAPAPAVLPADADEPSDEGDVYSANTLTPYFREARGIGLLSAEEESEIGRRLEEIDLAFGEKLFATAPLPPFAAEKLKELGIDAKGLPRAARKIVDALRDKNIVHVPALMRDFDQDASKALRRRLGPLRKQAQGLRDEFVRTNLRLAVAIAKKFAWAMPLSDAIQEGNIGLMEAVDRWDWRKGFRFSTYASWWIRQSINRGLAATGATIRLPVHLREFASSIYKAQKMLRRSLGREPLEEEIADCLGVAVAKVKLALAAARAPLSLDAPVGDDEEGSSFGSLLGDERAVDPETAASRKSDKASVHAALGKLKKMHRFVLEQRMDEDSTLKSIGDELGISRERVRQLEAFAKKRLRHHILHPGAEPDDDAESVRRDVQSAILDYLVANGGEGTHAEIMKTVGRHRNLGNWLKQLVRRRLVTLEGGTYRLPTCD